MPDSIFHESMRQGIACFFFCFFVCFVVVVVVVVAFCFLLFLLGDTSVFLRMKEKESVLSL